MARLGDVCTVVSGSTPKTNVVEYWDGDVKWITPAELNEDSWYILESVRHISEKGRVKTGLSYMPVGTVVLSSRAPIGKTAILGCEMCCNQGFKNLICSERIFNEYLYFFLSGKTKHLNALGRGATFKEISKSIVEEILIPLPSIEEQKRIAERFKKLVILISLRKQQLAKLNELVKSQFIEMFGDPILNPKNYKKILFKDLCTNIGDGLHGTPVYDDNGAYYFINGNNLRENKIIITAETRRVNKNEYDKFFTKLTDNSVLLSINGTLGNTAFYNGEPIILGKSACYSNLGNRLNKYFVQGLFSGDVFQSFMEKAATGTTILNFGLTTLREFEMIVPPLTEQGQYAAFVESIDKSKFAIQKSLEKLETLKKALMQKYFG